MKLKVNTQNGKAFSEAHFITSGREKIQHFHLHISANFNSMRVVRALHGITGKHFRDEKRLAFLTSASYFLGMSFW